MTAQGQQNPVRQVRWIGRSVVLDVVGDVDLSRSLAFQQSLLAVLDKHPLTVVVNLEKVPYMDSSGVASLVKLLSRSRKQKVSLRLAGMTKRVRSIFEITRLDGSLQHTSANRRPWPDMPASTASKRGEIVWGHSPLAGVRYLGGMTLLMGQTVRWTALGMFSPKYPFGSQGLARQVLRIGLRSVAVVALVQGFIGVILALQMTPPLKPWGQVDKVAKIIGVAGFRMLGPIITAVVLSGFAGASIAAELGTMVVTEEIEAMQAIALNPVRFLVVPRDAGPTLVVMVLLSVLADMMIALGGYMTATIVLGAASSATTGEHMREQLGLRDFFTGLVHGGRVRDAHQPDRLLRGPQRPRRGRGRRQGHHHDRRVLHRGHHRRRLRVHGGLLRLQGVSRHADEEPTQIASRPPGQEVIRVAGPGQTLRRTSPCWTA